MKKILSLLLVSSSVFSMQLMQLDHIKQEKLYEKLSQYNSSHMSDGKKVYINPSSVFVP